MGTTHQETLLTARAKRFYGKALDILIQSEVPFLVGGAFALREYTGIGRDTKDIDVFMKESDVPAALEAFRKHGMPGDYPEPAWLAKAYEGDHFIDLIFGSGNQLCDVDDLWFAHSRPGTVLGRPIRLCPPEEMIWQKAFIQERHRYDGADVLHLLLVGRECLDWERLLDRFGDHWRVLLSHLILFGYVYPRYRDKVPAFVMQELLGRLASEEGPTARCSHLCRGPYLSRFSYAIDLEKWGFEQPRGLKIYRAS